MKKVFIFGASGNIGSQALDILLIQNKEFELVGISVGQNQAVVERILMKFPSIKYVYSANQINNDLMNRYPHIYFWYENLVKDFPQDCQFDVALNALSGFFGLETTLALINKNKTILLANKESLVTGGELINSLLSNESNHAKIYPIDSEHCAIWQCLKQETRDLKTIWLTASGGQFSNLSLKQLEEVSYNSALQHPNWNMGAKITVDSSTMFNKAFEILEAKHLFKTNNIEVVIHPQSIVHSFVQFKDNAYIAQFSNPDMRQIISFFLNYPYRKQNDSFNEIDFNLNQLWNFQKIDEKRFKAIKFAKICLISQNSKAVALNAANEVAVENFLNKKIKFYQIENFVENIFTKCDNVSLNTYNEIKAFDKKMRNLTQNLIKESEK